MKKLLLIFTVILLLGCAAATDMTKLDASRYPLAVRNGDIVDKYIFDQTYMPQTPMYRKIFERDY